MAPGTKAYIAGVGVSPLPSNDSSAAAVTSCLVSAGTKALLDAGVTFESITHGVRSDSSSNSSKAFTVFEDGGADIEEAQGGSELGSSLHLIRDRKAKSVLVIAEEESSAIALVIVSEDFLWSRPYLKDSSTLVQEVSHPASSPSTTLYDVCQIVWNLRGWSKETSSKEERFSYQGTPDQRLELSRADAKDVPRWEDVEHKQDGKHRLGYNPATEMKEISDEDLEAVSASEASSAGQNRPRFKQNGGDRAALARL